MAVNLARHPNNQQRVRRHSNRGEGHNWNQHVVELPRTSETSMTVRDGDLDAAEVLGENEDLGAVEDEALVDQQGHLHPRECQHAEVRHVPLRGEENRQDPLEGVDDRDQRGQTERAEAQTARAHQQRVLGGEDIVAVGQHRRGPNANLGVVLV
ncbi:unnamed protein product [Phytophthora lilii]|uniref:Unnamed protein product n=1 Tax=Phytophthora lilii TaxID=2077276 RepID=A0A9W6UDX9_9STRA|nr:unnamed protein product [Phytophthora lilii]